MSGEIWGSAEARKSASGVFPDARDSNHELYLSWIRDCDARKCHSITLMDRSIDPLLRTRALLFRGELHGARREINQLLERKDASAELRSDALLESARLAAYEGDWNSSLRLACDAIETQRLEPISYLSILQVRALANFELDRFTAAARDLAEADSLGAIFPFSISWHYARILRVRLAARSLGLDEALQSLDLIWAELVRLGGPTAEQVHALVFGEIDIRRQALREGRPSPARLKASPEAPASSVGSGVGSGRRRREIERLALASYAMTEAMGERLYGALAMAELAALGPEEFRASFRSRCESARTEFRRIDRVCREVFGDDEPSSLTTKELRRLGHTDSGSLPAPRSVSEVAPVHGQVIDTRHGWVFQLSPWRAFSLERHPQLLKAFQVLAARDGSLSKVDFFGAVWGGTKYASRLHDSSIWYLLTRIRKLTGISYRVVDNKIRKPKDVLVL